MIADDYAALAAAQAQEEAARLDAQGAPLSGLFVRRACPICGDDGEQPALFSKAGMEIVRCRRCPMVYSRSILGAEAERAFYGDTAFQQRYLRLKRNAGYAELETRKSRYIVERLARFVSPPGRLLEIGCGTGRFLQQARMAGWTVLGVEPNAAFAAECRREGLPVIETWFPQATAEADGRRYDAVVLLDVLEHAAQPVALLAAVRSRVAAAGVVAIQVPNFDSLLLALEGERSPVICHGHWNYFTGESLERCARAAGLRPLYRETVISELDRIGDYPRSRVAEALAALRPGAAMPDQPSAEWIHRLELGHKILAFFAA